MADGKIMLISEPIRPAAGSFDAAAMACGEPGCPDCAIQCSVCGRTVCLNHVGQCSTCKTALCSDHALRCASCGKTFCVSHFDVDRGVCTGCSPGAAAAQPALSPVQVTCTSCSATLKIAPQYLGKRGKCPKCGAVFTAEQS